MGEDSYVDYMRVAKVVDFKHQMESQRFDGALRMRVDVEAERYPL